MTVAVTILSYVKQAVNVRERPKLQEKIVATKKQRLYCIVWPYILFKFLKDNG